MGRRVVVIGGGAAGIFAALAASESGADVVLYERNPRIGIKILISGGGKCNITHDAPPREIENGFITREARFLRYALHELTSAQVLSMLHAEGIETYTRPNGRVFPTSGRAEDVLAAFERMLERAGVAVQVDARVESVDVVGDRVTGVMVRGALERCDAAIICTGGMSYRRVGTTGDGIGWGDRSGHRIEPVRAALAPIYFPSPPPSDWQGVALRDVRFWIECDGRVPEFPRGETVPTEWRDDLLLTHRGVSGPAALEVSRAAARARELFDTVTLHVDLVPDISPSQLVDTWNERLAVSGKSQVQTFVEAFLPHSLVQYLLSSCGVTSGVKLAAATREERGLLLGTLKSWAFGEVGEVPIDRGEVTAGGIALDDVSSRTMESKRIAGLYFAGETLDIAGSVGGYNLQAAFATGYVAGRNAARSLN